MKESTKERTRNKSLKMDNMNSKHQLAGDKMFNL